MVSEPKGQARGSLKVILFPLGFVSFWLASSHLPFGFNKCGSETTFKQLKYGCLLIIFVALWDEQNHIKMPYGVHSESIILLSMHYSCFSWKLDYNFLLQAWLTDNIFMLTIFNRLQHGCLLIIFLALWV